VDFFSSSYETWFILIRLNRCTLYSMNVHSPLILLCLSLVMTGPVEAESFSKYKNHKMYDRYFSKYAKRFFGAGFDWTHFKAQAIAESNLNIKAKSHVGAVGLMQIMPATFVEITQKNKFIEGSAGEPRWNIAAGISYNRSLWNYWRADRGFQDKLNFMFASYNAGRGNIRKAQRFAEKERANPNLWSTIEKHLVKVTGRHSRETLAYIDRIQIITKDIQ